MAKLKYDEVLVINGQKIDKHYIQSLNKNERLELVEPIFEKLRESGFVYPDKEGDLKKEYARLCNYKVNVELDVVNNNSSLATNICRYFCHSFYNTSERGKQNLIEIFNDDKKLKRIIENRLGLDWLEDDEKNGVIRPGVNEAFNLSFKMFIQGMRSMRMINATSMFKPDVAKFIYEKYSQVGDVVGDYSCGFGGRLLGAMSCGRSYIGTDPLTVPELEKMVEYFEFKNVKLIQSGSEEYRGEENSVDLYWSSPPYYDQEYYSEDSSQAYNKDENYFYDKYWSGTLDNVKWMLKPGKTFGLNITEKYERMISMAKKKFGEPVEILKLKTVRSHLTKTAGVEKFEPFFVFKNVK
jgi:hypothetical protein